MKHEIVCSNIKCKFNNDYNNHCVLKFIGLDNEGKCASCVIIDRSKIRKIDTSIMDEHTNMC